MHDSVLTFVAEQVEIHELAQLSTIDVGSYDVNGTVKPLFRGEYVGVDMRDGPNVDFVAFADDLPFKDDLFSVVVCTEMLEHDVKPWKSVKEMARVLKPDGYLILTCRGYDGRGCFPIHTHPDDLWRFSVGAVHVLLSNANLRVVDVRSDPEAPGVFAVARKR